MWTVIRYVGLVSALGYLGCALTYAYILITSDEFNEPYDDEL